MGVIEAAPGHVVVIPRGVRFRVEVDGPVRGYVCENYGAPFRLPDLGPIGSNGLANPRDFETPVAWFEDVDRPTQCVQKYGGQLWATTFGHSPLDVVGWHGNYAPYRYDTARFNTIGTVVLRPPRPVDLHRPDQPVGHARARPTATSSSSRRAGWWPRTPSVRRGSTGTS